MSDQFLAKSHQLSAIRRLRQVSASKRYQLKRFVFVGCLLFPMVVLGQSAKPWVFWYWMQASVSKPGITADLEAMKQNGIGGAFLMPIKGVVDPPLFSPPTEQLSARWWEMMRFALQEAQRLKLEIGMHVSDGFALAGGPWITPELSMQKVVASSVMLAGGTRFNGKLPQPPANENYYRDIKVYAYPSSPGSGISTRNTAPEITTSNGADAAFLVQEATKLSFKSDTACWVQYQFAGPFTCRSLTIRTGGNNFQAQRLLVQVSDDGKIFRDIGRLQPSRHGWQDTDADYTYSLAPVTARYFRFVYDKAGTEPGAEDLDAAKWKPSLKLTGLWLSAEPRIHQYEGKTGEVWRISERTDSLQVPGELCVPVSKMVDLTSKMRSDGSLEWDVPPGSWTVIRMGHTSTGHRNDTGGGGKGLECDKFNPAAIQLQFDRWYGEALRQAGPELAKALTVFHVDSWECGSQNWSVTFPGEFKKRRGYDLLPYLPVMAGIPVGSAGLSEKVLHDVRETIAELVADSFYQTLATLAKAKNVTFTAESVAPTMTGDGLLHYKKVDVPMGEFWLNSPTHDKPNDMSDAISGAHIYGKPVVMAEAFTSVRMAWNEHPGMLKTLQDRNYALGINKLSYHVFMHNPWMDRKPGMTLDGVGLYFQRDQTWWKPGKAWVQYAERCQALLQQGKPVTDIAVFTGEEIPRRSVLPDRLVTLLPGIFGPGTVTNEAKRLANTGEPLRQIPSGVSHTANMADPENWVDPLRGYAYDSFNPDVLRTAISRNGKVELASGATYGLLVIPGKHAMNPNYRLMSLEVAAKLLELVKAGAKIVVGERPVAATGLRNQKEDRQLAAFLAEIWDGDFSSIKSENGTIEVKSLGKGMVIRGPYRGASFEPVGLEPDVYIHETVTTGGPRKIAWNHRRTAEKDIYFIANQEAQEKTLDISFRVQGRVPELYDAVTNTLLEARQWTMYDGRTRLKLPLAPNGSVFVIFKTVKEAPVTVKNGTNATEFAVMKPVNAPWQVKFDASFGGPKSPVSFASLTDWSTNPDSLIRYYSGTAVYTATFNLDRLPAEKVWIDLGKVANIAEITVNGIDCGVVWTPPYRTGISQALRKGVNQLTIKVTNTWANRLIGDQRLPVSQRVTQTTAPFRLAGKPLQEAGLLGPVVLKTRLKDQ